MRQLKSIYLPAVVLVLTATGFAQDLKPIALPKPQLTGGKSLMQALADRKTTREFSAEALSPQTLSNLLWAAFGVNREAMERGGPGRTAPSAMNRQEIQLYVLLPEGAYLYEAVPHALKPVAAGDIRAKAGPAYAANAAVTIVYVANSDEGSAAVDSGFIGQNVYLFASAFGLNSVFRGSGVAGLVEPLKLTGKQKPLYAQTVGYPVKK